MRSLAYMDNDEYILMFQVEDIVAQSQSYVFVAEGRARASE